MKLKWEVKRRLEEIERCLFWAGRLRRSDLTDKFGISVQQASADIKHYQSIVPESIIFNRSLRQYEPIGEFIPSFIAPSIKDYVDWQSHTDRQIQHVPVPLREVEIPSLRIIVNTLHKEKSVEIDYQSLTSSKISTRRITPHSVVFDGYRYHVRAFCHFRDDFRDFVLGRICRAENVGKPGKSKDEDMAWNMYLPLRLGPHPKLTPNQRKIIEKDFGMKDGELLLKVRQAMLIYTLTQLRIDQFVDKREPKDQQIILLNPDILNFS